MYRHPSATPDPNRYAIMRAQLIGCKEHKAHMRYYYDLWLDDAMQNRGYPPALPPKVAPALHLLGGLLTVSCPPCRLLPSAPTPYGQTSDFRTWYTDGQLERRL